MSFYVTVLPPGRAEGADSWSDCLREQEMDETFEGEAEEYMDEEYDELGNLRPLDYFFPRN